MSGSRSSSPNSKSEWSRKENKMFEEALAYYGEDTPNRWDKVASAMGGIKSAEEIRCHYEDLTDDVKTIESGRVQFPKYKTQGYWTWGKKEKKKPCMPPLNQTWAAKKKKDNLSPISFQNYSRVEAW